MNATEKVARAVADLTQEEARRYFSYEDGELIWRVRENSHRWWNTRYAGRAAGRTDPQGYKCVRLRGRDYKVHRVIYILFHGDVLGSLEVDHIDRNPVNNQIENLRAVTRAQNRRNLDSFKGSSSKYLGVCWDNRAGRWVAQIKRGGKRKTIGLFDDEVEAAKAYDIWAQMFDPIYCGLNFPTYEKEQK